MKIIKYSNIAFKLLLIVLLAHLLLYPDLPQYQNKGMAWRLAGYPLVCFAIAFTYHARRRLGKRNGTYPHFIDLLLTLTITTDMLGNTLDLYNSIGWWDDLMHLTLSIPWVSVIGLALRAYYPRLSRLNTAALTFGFGAVTHILWELAEYISFVPNNAIESQSAYRDTMGDLTLSLIGSLVGAVLIATVLWEVGRKHSIIEP